MYDQSYKGVDRMSIGEIIVHRVDISEKLSGKDVDIIADIIHGVLMDEGIDTDNDDEDLDGFTFEVIAYYEKEITE
tara:strand:+ start:6 stop:233 length:228 start_codon:yes stop_codon:yes gene_type:complete